MLVMGQKREEGREEGESIAVLETFGSKKKKRITKENMCPRLLITGRSNMVKFNSIELYIVCN
jgi:hypothetical protein